MSPARSGDVPRAPVISCARSGDVARAPVMSGDVARAPVMSRARSGDVARTNGGLECIWAGTALASWDQRSSRMDPNGPALWCNLLSACIHLVQDLLNQAAPFEWQRQRQGWQADHSLAGLQTVENAAPME